MHILNKKAFTLTELLVIIVIITIITLSVMSIDYSKLTDKQKLDIFTNKVVSSYEWVRNYSLIWKWVWVNLDLPNTWKIEYWVSSWWEIVSSYSTWWSFVKYDDFSILPDNNYSISSIDCVDRNLTAINTSLVSTWIVLFQWWNISFSWSCALENVSKLKLNINFAWNIKPIYINSLNWIVEWN